MALRLVDSDIVHMDKRTFMWIQLAHFAIETPPDDRSLLGSLIASPAYAHDYASPFEAAAVVTEPAVQRRLQDIYALLRSGDVYKLDNPGAENEHEYGFVTGGMGFHEFVVIDRNRRSVHVVVASDD